ncbi:hypothetical protein B0T24DRAFT_124868 [Lasiosphaeria ovina]|uniref:Uncharacterized protein n=1 Tax=Lasiosphaeria ovina TaxID=92902 RepID=A0AAE0MYU8_9PEZI|nr:hypothetical protein B0T24DRAFT_124868 [Lasiosphaeria ovina]
MFRKSWVIVGACFLPQGRTRRIKLLNMLPFHRCWPSVPVVPCMCASVRWADSGDGPDETTSLSSNQDAWTRPLYFLILFLALPPRCFPRLSLPKYCTNTPIMSRLSSESGSSVPHRAVVQKPLSGKLHGGFRWWVCDWPRHVIFPWPNGGARWLNTAGPIAAGLAVPTG